MPLGISTAATGISRRGSWSMSSAARPAIGRDRPVPNSASTASFVPSRDCDAGRMSPCQSAAIAAASPSSDMRSPTSTTRTAQPSRCKYRATTNPSPPLLPGPQSTTAGLFVHRLIIASATALPAFSIRAWTLTPALIACRSACAMSLGVSSSRRWAGDGSMGGLLEHTPFTTFPDTGPPSAIVNSRCPTTNGCPYCLKFIESCAMRVRRFLGNTSGSVAVILGIVATVMVGAAGVAVDFVNASYIRTSLQHALDSAVLAASSSHVETDSEAEALIHEYMDSNWKQKFPTLAVDIKPKLGKDKITSDATTEVPTLLMGILGIKDIAIRVSSTATATESTIEVAMVIVNSSSMQSNLTLLKNSLLAVTETLDSSLSTNVKYAIVPYSVYVNVGTSNKNKSWLSFSGVDKKSWTGCVGSRDYPLELEDSGSTAIPTVTTSLCNPTELLPLTSNVSKVEEWISDLEAEVDDTYMASGLIW